MNDQMKSFSADLNPEDARLAELLDKAARQIELNPSFQAALESRLRDAHKPKGVSTMPLRKLLPALGWAVGLALLALALNWVIRSLAPEPVPFAGSTPTFAAPPEAPTPIPIVTSVTVYNWNWRGTSLALSVPLPGSPAEANVYLYQPEQRATLESARALAAQLGLNGAVHGVRGKISDATDFLIVDGNQRLSVRSDQYR